MVKDQHLPYCLSIPIIEINLDNIKISLIASNNPWTGKIVSSLDHISIISLLSQSSSLAPSSSEIMKENEINYILNLNQLGASIDFTQTSTLSKYLSKLTPLTILNVIL